MPNDLFKRDYAKMIIKLFLLELDQKKRTGCRITEEELNWVSSKQKLAQYVYQQKQHPIYTTDSSGKGDSGKVNTISESSIYNAIRELEDEGSIEIKNHHFQIKHNNSDIARQHAIVKIAPELEITYLPLNDVALFRVPEQHAGAIANYINSQFYCNDICCVALSSYILCFDIQLPAQSKFILKREPLAKRLRKVLRRFKLLSPKDSREYSGFTEHEIIARESQAAYAEYERQSSHDKTYGGKIVVQVKRKIKKN